MFELVVEDVYEWYYKPKIWSSVQNEVKMLCLEQNTLTTFATLSIYTNNVIYIKVDYAVNLYTYLSNI